MLKHFIHSWMGVHACVKRGGRGLKRKKKTRQGETRIGKKKGMMVGMGDGGKVQKRARRPDHKNNRIESKSAPKKKGGWRRINQSRGEYLRDSAASFSISASSR